MLKYFSVTNKKELNLKQTSKQTKKLNENMQYFKVKILNILNKIKWALRINFRIILFFKTCKMYTKITKLKKRE